MGSGEGHITFLGIRCEVMEAGLLPLYSIIYSFFKVLYIGLRNSQKRIHLLSFVHRQGQTSYTSFRAFNLVGPVGGGDGTINKKRKGSL